METMQAVVINYFGGPEQLQLCDTPIPEPEADEVLIEVKAMGINPLDWKLCQGLYTELIELPAILGWDVSGKIVKVGSNVKRFVVGDSIYAFKDFTKPGVYSEFTTLHVDEIALKPKNIDFVHAAAMPLAVLTAWQALFEYAQLAPKQKILIHAAAGGVGHFAVQLAKWKEARVVGTASAHNKDFLQDLGVDQFIDYTIDDFSAMLDNIDVVLDTIGGDTRVKSFKTLKETGVQISIVDTSNVEEIQKMFKKEFIGMIVKPSGRQLQAIAKLVEKDVIKPYVDKVFHFSEVAKAHALSESRHVRGKIVLHCDETSC